MLKPTRSALRRRRRRRAAGQRLSATASASMSDVDRAAPGRAGTSACRRVAGPRRTPAASRNCSREVERAAVRGCRARRRPGPRGRRGERRGGRRARRSAATASTACAARKRSERGEHRGQQRDAGEHGDGGADREHRAHPARRVVVGDRRARASPRRRSRPRRRSPARCAAARSPSRPALRELLAVAREQQQAVVGARAEHQHDQDRRRLPGGLVEAGLARPRRRAPAATR